MTAPRTLWINCCCSIEDTGGRARLPQPGEAFWNGAPGELVSVVRQRCPHAVCIEYDYPDRRRLEAVPLLRRNFPALPVLMLTEYHSEALAVWAFRHRVWDYRVKPITEHALARLLAALTDIGPRLRGHGWLADTVPPELIVPSGQLRTPLTATPRTAWAIAYISEHYGEPVRIATLAHLCHLSESEFSRIFHREHGVSCRQFLLNYRIAMARDFLAQPGIPISEVAYTVGFNDLSHFGRMFRRIVGESATTYQRRLQPRAGTTAVAPVSPQ